MQRSVLEHDDVCELQEHEFTLEPDEPLDPPTPSVPLPTRRWLPPLPKWAARSRALLERWAARETDDVMIDDEPTPVMPAVECSVTELRALRQELAWVTRELYARELRVEQLASALDAAHTAALAEAQKAAELAARQAASTTALRGELLGQAHLIDELESALRTAQLRSVREVEPTNVPAAAPLPLPAPESRAHAGAPPRKSSAAPRKAKAARAAPARGERQKRRAPARKAAGAARSEPRPAPAARRPRKTRSR